MDVACDTVCWAIATQPATELLEAAGIAPGDAISLVGDCAAAATGMDAVAAWAKALADVQTGETVICQCEEVSRDDLIGVQPPRYLGRPPAMIARSLASLLQDGPAHPDQIKRLTRAGMGPCQGRRCRTQVACLLGAETGVPFERVPTASYRAPVRPVPLALLADWAERSTMADGWDVWFGIPTQWVPYADIGTEREAAHLDVNMHV
jgi:hypothetical protein